MANNISSHIQALRAEMKQHGIAAAIIPHVDPHQSEYIADHWQVRRYLSGFTGSAGWLLVTLDKALLWTDSRYFLQAAEQLKDSPVELMKEGLPETPTMTQYIIDNIAPGSTVGIDGMLIAHDAKEALREDLGRHGIKLDTDFDPIDSIWPDRPALPADPVIIHDVKFAGRSAKDKIAEVFELARKNDAQDVLITALDEIAWLLNIRSTDVPCNPVATSFLYLSPEESTLFIDPAKLTSEVIAYLKEQGVAVAGYNDILPFLAKTERRVMFQSERTAERLYNAIREDLRRPGASPIALAKAIKNEVQIEGEKEALRRDGAALVEAVMEIEERLASGKELTEIDVDDILLKHRSAREYFFDRSFETICGYGPHGAIVHYSATPESNATIRPEGLLLIDSGAQYYDGTTDITRTIAVGMPTAQEKSDFTLVMKGHIALAKAIYPEGTRGAQLDVLARQFLWKNGLTYLHGTGHGVGHFLNVHEGPQSIRLNDMPATLRPGMITSNEPGIYREGVHGIRCENLVLTVPAFETEFGKFYKFETITLFPFDRKLFDLSLMTEEEIAWVNEYHERVYVELCPLLDTPARDWLRKRTLPLE